MPSSAAPIAPLDAPPSPVPNSPVPPSPNTSGSDKGGSSSGSRGKDTASSDKGASGSDRSSDPPSRSSGDLSSKSLKSDGPPCNKSPSSSSKSLKSDAPSSSHYNDPSEKREKDKTILAALLTTHLTAPLNVINEHSPHKTRTIKPTKLTNPKGAEAVSPGVSPPPPSNASLIDRSITPGLESDESRESSSANNSSQPPSSSSSARTSSLSSLAASTASPDPYTPEEVAALQGSYAYLTMSYKGWENLKHFNIAWSPMSFFKSMGKAKGYATGVIAPDGGVTMKKCVVKGKSGGDNTFGKASAIIDNEPSYVLNFIMDWVHPYRVEVNKPSDLARAIIAQVNSHTRIFYGTKRLPDPWLPREVVTMWTNFTFPDGRILIASRSCELPAQDPTNALENLRVANSIYLGRKVRAKFNGSIMLTPSGVAGQRTLMTLVLNGDPMGKFPLQLYNAAMSITLSLVAETKEYFAQRDAFGNKVDNAKLGKDQALGHDAKYLGGGGPRPVGHEYQETDTAEDTTEEDFCCGEKMQSRADAMLDLAQNSDPGGKGGKKFRMPSFSSWLKVHLKRIDAGKTHLEGIDPFDVKYFTTLQDKGEGAAILDEEFSHYQCSQFSSAGMTCLINEQVLMSLTLVGAVVEVSTTKLKDHYLPDVLALPLYFAVNIAAWCYCKYSQGVFAREVAMATEKSQRKLLAIKVKRTLMIMFMLLCVGHFVFFYSLCRIKQHSIETEACNYEARIISPEAAMLILAIRILHINARGGFMPLSVKVYNLRVSFVLVSLGYAYMLWWETVNGLERNHPLRASFFIALYVLVSTVALQADASFRHNEIKARFGFHYLMHHELHRYECRALREQSKMTPAQRKIMHDVLSQVHSLRENDEGGLFTDVTELKATEVEFNNEIGNGKFGLVFQGRYDNKAVAVKQVIPEGITRQAAMSFVAEIHILSGLKHRNIIDCVGVVLGVSHLALVLEFASIGSLQHVLRNTKNLTWRKEKKHLLMQVCSGMQYLHGVGIIHRDLKAANVLVTGDWIAKVSDFGLAKAMGKNSNSAADIRRRGESQRCGDMPDMTTMLGTPIYMAPEVISSQPEGYDEKVDVFSWGMMLADVAYDGWLEKLVKGEGEDKISSANWLKRVAGGWRFNIPPHWSRDIPLVAVILSKCLSQNPEERPSFGELRNVLKGWDGEIDNRLVPEAPVIVTPVSAFEEEFVTGCLKVFEDDIAAADSSLWLNVKSADPLTSMKARRVGSKWHYVVRRNIPFQSFRVFNWMWDWMDPVRISHNKNGGELERSVVETVNEHHRFLSCTKGIGFFGPSGKFVHAMQPRSFVMRSVWMETHPRTYVLVFRSTQHPERPAQDGVVRAFSNITLVLEPMADGSTQAEYSVESDLQFTGMPFWLSKLAAERNGTLLNECAIDLTKRSVNPDEEEGRVNEAWFLKDGNLSNSGLWSTAMGAGGGVYDVGRDDDDDDEGASSSALDIEQGRPGQEDELMPQVGGSNDWVDEGAMQGRRRRRTGRGA